MTKDEIVWEVPTSHEQQSWAARLTPLMSRAGEWARIQTRSRQGAVSFTASSLKRGVLKAPPGRWEFRTARLEDGRYGAYARYLGPEEPAK